MNISLITTYNVGTSSYPTLQQERFIYSIKGQVQQLGIGRSALVNLYDKRTYQHLSTVKTDENGNYKFTGLAKVKTYFVISHHPQSLFNAVIQDNVVPK